MGQVHLCMGLLLAFTQIKQFIGFFTCYLMGCILGWY